VILKLWNKLGAGTPLSEEEQQVADKSTFLVQQFKAHHRINKPSYKLSSSISPLGNASLYFSKNIAFI
jgi:hypothetical protein